MCPICWTTTLAAFSALVIASAIATAGADKWSLLGIAGLSILICLRQAEIIQAKWQPFVALIVIVASRVAWLMLRHPGDLAAVRLWRQSLALAKRRCPRQGKLD